MKTLINSLLAAAVLFVTGCGTLAPDGVYGGHKVLYVADQSFETSHDILDAFLKWENDNRESLFRIAPQIKHQADSIRQDAPAWIAKFEAARTAYMLAPTMANDTLMDEALDELVRLSAAAQSITTKFNQ